MKHLGREDHPQHDTDETCASLILTPSANPAVGFSGGLVFGHCSLNKNPSQGAHSTYEALNHPTLLTRFASYSVSSTRGGLSYGLCQDI